MVRTAMGPGSLREDQRKPKKPMAAARSTPALAKRMGESRRALGRGVGGASAGTSAEVVRADTGVGRIGASTDGGRAGTGSGVEARGKGETGGSAATAGGRGD